jgi:Ribonuclease G/E
MPKRATTSATPSDFPKIDLAGRYLEYMRLREIVQKAERRRSHGMDRDREKQAIREKLTRYRQLASEFPDGITAKNLSDLTDELEQKLRQLENE